MSYCLTIKPHYKSPVSHFISARDEAEVQYGVMRTRINLPASIITLHIGTSVPHAGVFPQKKVDQASERELHAVRILPLREALIKFHTKRTDPRYKTFMTPDILEELQKRLNELRLRDPEGFRKEEVEVKRSIRT